MRLLALFVFLITACSTPDESNVQWEVPHHGFPPLPFPENNPMEPLRVALGEKLFFDPMLSRDKSISCASCHLPEKAFTDGRPVAIGVEGRKGTRNSPTILNVAYHPYFFLEGGNPILETQMLGPLETHEEMDFSIAELIPRLENDEEYVRLFNETFPDKGIHPYSITASIAAYERSLLSGNSRFDRFYYFGENSFTNSEMRGWELFQKFCVSCHTGPMLSDFGFENVGLYQEYQDLGRMRVTRDSADLGKVKTPSLRNVALTAPYMHDGSMSNLREVVEHYNRGGFNHPNKSPLIRPLNLDEADKKALEDFLHTLSDRDFL
jgi:cytochrome c peroxidase